LSVRLAPTPSGYLHLGNIYNFLLTFVYAKRNNLPIHLRIDDADGDRVRSEYINDIFETLHWLGFSWDFGPKNSKDFSENFSQLKKIKYYKKELESLKPHLYNCQCSRSDIKKNSIDGSYPGTCRQLDISFQENLTATRFKNTTTPKIEDMILWRKNNSPAYQWFSLIDDRDLGTTVIIRGEDLRSSSLFQQNLSHFLPKNPLAKTQLFHHPLLVGENGKKLSKSEGVESIQSLKTQGLRPEEVLGMATQQHFSHLFPRNIKLLDLISSESFQFNFLK